MNQIEQMILSESYDDNKLAVIILRETGYTEYQIVNIIINLIDGKPTTEKYVKRYFTKWAIRISSDTDYQTIIKERDFILNI